MQIQAAVCQELNGEFNIETIKLDAPKPDEVLVEIVATGVCHTDAAGMNGTIPVPFPMVFGHEGAGIVKEVGEVVHSVKAGDHVVVSFPYCGTCQPCLFGHPGECEHMIDNNFSGYMGDGTTRLSKNGKPIYTFFGQSTFANYAVVNEKNLVKVDKDVDLALLGPLGCGLITGSATVMEGIRPKTGSSIAIYGCGSVGLSAIMGAKIVGCSTIIAVDLNHDRLQLAKELGATHIINSQDVSIIDAANSITDGYGVEYAVDATGSAFVVDQALKSLAHHGELVLIASGYGSLEIDLNNDIFMKVRTIRGMIEGSTPAKHFIPKLVDYYKKGLFPIDKLIKFYDFEDINQAFADTENGSTIKPVLRMKK